ncbi:MAG TPA: peptidylprolyl isomerase [Clostridia bacterium]|nr:peptidylprolyl isomerase [Clostridia bacterium]
MRKLVFVLLAIFAFAIPTFSQEDTVVEEIIARINNAIVTRADLRRSREQTLQELRQQNPNVTQAEIAEREKVLLRDLIDQQLLVQKGQDLGITADTETIKRLDEIRKQMNAGSMEELEKLAEQQGIQFEDFKQNMRNSIITQQVIGREVGSHIQVTADEIKKFYEEHKAEMEQPELVRLSEILVAAVPTPPPSGDKSNEQPKLVEATPEQLAQAEAKAQELLKKIKDGAKFEDVAKQSSNGPTAEQGGELGEFKRGVLSKELEDKAFSMKTGEMTDVIRTKQGFIIMKVTQHTQPGVPTMAQAESRIQDAIYMQKMQPALREYLTKLREEAYIDVKPGYIDEGASPNQTKPEVASSTPSPATQEKAKRKKHFLIF